MVLFQYLCVNLSESSSCSSYFTNPSTHPSLFPACSVTALPSRTRAGSHAQHAHTHPPNPTSPAPAPATRVRVHGRRPAPVPCRCRRTSGSRRGGECEVRGVRLHGARTGGDLPVARRVSGGDVVRGEAPWAGGCVLPHLWGLGGRRGLVWTWRGMGMSGWVTRRGVVWLWCCVVCFVVRVHF
jgi:hypothetical protein